MRLKQFNRNITSALKSKVYINAFMLMISIGSQANAEGLTSIPVGYIDKQIEIFQQISSITQAALLENGLKRVDDAIVNADWIGRGSGRDFSRLDFSSQKGQKYLLNIVDEANFTLASTLGFRSALIVTDDIIDTTNNLRNLKGQLESIGSGLTGLANDIEEIYKYVRDSGNAEVLRVIADGNTSALNSVVQDIAIRRKIEDAVVQLNSVSGDVSELKSTILDIVGGGFIESVERQLSSPEGVKVFIQDRIISDWQDQGFLEDGVNGSIGNISVYDVEETGIIFKRDQLNISSLSEQYPQEFEENIETSVIAAAPTYDNSNAASDEQSNPELISAPSASSEDVQRMRSLIQEGRSVGGIGNLSSQKRSLLISLTRKIDSSLQNFSDDEVLRRTAVNFNSYAREYGVQEIDFSSVITSDLEGTVPLGTSGDIVNTIGFEGDNFYKDPIFIFDPNAQPVADEVNAPTEIGLVISENNQGEPVLGNNAGTNIEIPTAPTGPTPEEIAAEEERLAELRRQEIARLELERTAQFEIKLAREVQIQNIDNELALLKFGDQEEAQNALSLVTGEEQRLRAELNDTGLSAADQQRLQDLLVYQETLESELDRINGRISSLEGERGTLQSELDSANTIIIANSNQLNALDYDYNQFTEPTTSEELIDWSDYDYELPPFNETTVPTSDIKNVVVSTVSLPVSDGNIRNSGTLISEDGSTIRYDVWNIDETRSEKLEGFTHLYWGTGTDGLQWVYGEASTPEQFALRTGTATFNGGLQGYYAHGTFDSNTVHQNSVSGNLALNINFGNNTLTGEGTLEIDSPVRTENLSFSLNEATIAENSDALRRSLGFSANAVLNNGVSGSGNFSGTFYGSDASEAAGSFAFGLVGGFAAGVWATGENYVPDGGGNNAYVGRITSQGLSRNIYDAEIGSGDSTISDQYTDVPVAQGAGGGEVRLTSKFNHDSSTDPYTYTSWGDWVANSNTIQNFSEGGYWVTADMMTPSSVIENKTGTASYSGNIVGDYVSNGTRQDATGQINLTADFSADTIQGQMQFGHGGAGTNAGGTVSPVANFVDVPINGRTFHQSAVDQTAGNGLNSFGVSGFFAGPNAEEVGGTAWMHLDDGSYNGVFRAKQ